MTFSTTLKIAARYIRVDAHQQASTALLTQLGEQTDWQLDGVLEAPIGELTKAGGFDFDDAMDAVRTLREAGLVHPEKLAVEWPEVIRSLSAFNRRELWDGACHEARRWIDQVIAETPEVSSRNDTLPEGELVPSAVPFQVDLNGTSYEEDLELGRKLAAMHKQVQFALGDYLLQASDKHGAKYADLLAELDLTYGVAKSLASIASKYEKSSRHDFLTYSHYVAAAPVKDEGLRAELLQRAERDSLSVSALRHEVRSIMAQAKPVEAPEAQPQPVAPRLPAPAVTVVDNDSEPVGTVAIDQAVDQQTTSTLDGPTQEERARRILEDFALLDEDQQRAVRAQVKDNGDLPRPVRRLNELLTPDSDGSFGGQDYVSEQLADILFDIYLGVGPLRSFCELTQILAQRVAETATEADEPILVLDAVFEGLAERRKFAEEEELAETYEFIAEVGESFVGNARAIGLRSEFFETEQARTKHVVAQLKEYHWIAAPPVRAYPQGQRPEWDSFKMP